MSVCPGSPFPDANRCLRAAMAARNCWHSSSVRCGAARSTNPFTSSLSSQSFPGLAPDPARTHSATPVTDNVVPGTFTPNYTSRNRVTRPPHVHTWRVLVPRIITPFGQGRRVSRALYQSLVPRSGFSFLVLDSNL